MNRLLNRPLPSLGTYRHFLYSHMKYNIEQNQSKSFILKRQLDLIVLGSYICRFLATVAMDKLSHFPYWKCDAFAWFIHENRDQFDTFFLANFAGFWFFCVFTQRAIYYSGFSDCVAWAKTYDYVVLARETYWSSLKAPNEIARIMLSKARSIKNRESNRWVKVLASQNFLNLIAKMKIYSNFEHVNRSKLARCQYRVIPQLSLPIQRLLILYQLGLDRVHQIWFPFVVFCYSGFILLYLPNLLEPFPIWYYPIITLDAMVYMNYIGYILYRNLMIIFTNTFLATLLYTRHITEWTELLRNSVYKHLDPRLGPQRMAQCLRILKLFITEHNYTAKLLLTEDRQVWSVCTCGAFLSQLPANIYFLYRVYVLSPDEHRIQWLASCFYVFGEMVMILLIIRSLSRITESMHFSQRYFPAIQMGTSKHAINTKLKLMSLYERLDLRNNRFKLGYSIGPICVITNQSFIQIILLYFAWILDAFSFFMKIGYKIY